MESHCQPEAVPRAREWRLWVCVIVCYVLGHQGTNCALCCCKALTFQREPVRDWARCLVNLQAHKVLHACSENWEGHMPVRIAGSPHCIGQGLSLMKSGKEAKGLGVQESRTG